MERQTKKQQFQQEENKAHQIVDGLFHKYNVMRDVLKEIAVPYPENNNADSAEILCKFLIAKAQEALRKCKP